ncbi:hypothetical protein [uncultured Dokdonia sp.]|uniref:hypothetical protein n=1 Tax=uncultured Dokdonia sp. TaxID=575653 RepID=UPI00260C4835|nr:hypothetical protein [uncultured Dokdonia sp.]
MKHFKSIITLLIFTAFISISCSNNDDDINQENLIGTWSLTSSIEEFNYEENTQNNASDFTLISTGSNFNFILTFYEDETLVKDGSYNINTTIITDTYQQSQVEVEEVNNQMSEWFLDESTLTITGGFIKVGSFDILSNSTGISELRIATLKEDKLVLTYELDQLEFVDPQDESNGSGELVFSR